jgi:hypothetical protein
MSMSSRHRIPHNNYPSSLQSSRPGKKQKADKDNECVLVRQLGGWEDTSSSIHSCRVPTFVTVFLRVGVEWQARRVVVWVG